eukprot:scpid91620/ scgid24055/ 
MIKMKGRSSLRQYMPNKPMKWGIKSFALADVTTSHLVDFDDYSGAVQGQTEIGTAHAMVINLAANYRQAWIHRLYRQFLHISATSNTATAPKWVPSCWHSSSQPAADSTTTEDYKPVRKR